MIETEKSKTADAILAETRLRGVASLAQYGDKRDVAAMLGLSVRTVDNLIAAGMPHLRLGARRCRFDMEEVRGWLKEKYGTRRRGAAKEVV